MSSANHLYTRLSQCRNLIKINGTGACGVMANYEIRAGNSLRKIMTPSVSVSLPSFCPIQDSYPWLPPLIVYDREHDTDKTSFLSLARRPFLVSASSCISVVLPNCFLKIEREDIIHQILSSLSAGRVIPTTFDDGSSLFELALDCQEKFPDKEVALLAELFLDTGLEIPHPGFDRFVSLVKRCEDGPGINLTANTLGYMRRTSLLSFVPNDKLQESSSLRPKF